MSASFGDRAGSVPALTPYTNGLGPDRQLCVYKFAQRLHESRTRRHDAERLAEKRLHAPTGLGHEQRARRPVPRVEAALVVAVEAPGREPREVEGRGAGAP